MRSAIHDVLRLRSLIWQALTGETDKRRTARYNLLNWLARRLGYRLANPRLTWPHDQSFLRLMRTFDPRYPEIRERHWGLHHLALSARDVVGDTAECGVFTGVSSFIIMKALNRAHFGFDSFAGLPEPLPEDAIRNTEVTRWKRGDLLASETEVRAALVPHGNVRLMKGWIPSRFAEVAQRTFAFVHIDVDLYDGTRDSLEFFYPRLNAGGVIVLDDYGFSTCPGATKAANEFMLGKLEHIIHLPTGQGLIFRRVHA